MSGGEITGRRADRIIIDDPHYDKDQTRAAVQRFMSGMTPEARRAFLLGQGPAIETASSEATADIMKMQSNGQIVDAMKPPNGNRKARRAAQARARK